MFPYVLLFVEANKRNDESVPVDYIGEGGDKNWKASKNQTILILQNNLFFPTEVLIYYSRVSLFFYYNNNEGGIATFY